MMSDYTLAQTPFPLGSPAPDFNLKGVDGKMHSLDSYQHFSILVIAAVCNHCPYVQAYLQRMIDLQSKYAHRGVTFVGINSNDEQIYPEDSFDHMVAMAREQGFNFDYLRDEDQAVAKAFHMERTPQFFVFDAERKLRYMGGLDNNYKDAAAVTEHPLEDAILDLLEGREVQKPVAHFIGCSVKWRESL